MRSAFLLLFPFSFPAGLTPLPAYPLQFCPPFFLSLRQALPYCHFLFIRKKYMPMPFGFHASEILIPCLYNFPCTGIKFGRLAHVFAIGYKSVDYKRWFVGRAISLLIVFFFVRKEGIRRLSSALSAEPARLRPRLPDSLMNYRPHLVKSYVLLEKIDEKFRFIFCGSKKGCIFAAFETNRFFTKKTKTEMTRNTADSLIIALNIILLWERDRK